MNKPITSAADALRILVWCDRVPVWKRWLLWHVLGLDFCPRCNRVVRWDWRALSVHEDGPPLFAEWVCRWCRSGTGLEPTVIMRDAMEKRS